jgi:hypothetical protein
MSVFKDATPDDFRVRILPRVVAFTALNKAARWPLRRITSAEFSRVSNHAFFSPPLWFPVSGASRPDHHRQNIGEKERKTRCAG